MNNKSPLISIIVPVYNTEKYLKRCLDSIIFQSLKNIEIIILDDGSPDDSWKIIEQYALQDDRIIFIRHENIGLGLTRNKGINIARGRYLSFVDSDDYIEHNMMELMYQKAEKEQLDVVVCETYMESDEERYVAFHFDETKPYHLAKTDNNSFFKEAILNDKYRYNAWNKLYRSDIVKKNNIVFGDNKKIYAEDLYFQFYLLSKMPVINFLPVPLYHYIQRKDSITNSLKKAFIERHLNLIGEFYKVAENDDFHIEWLIDCFFFRGLLNEARYCKQHNMSFLSYKRSVAVVYNSYAYSCFKKSVKQHKSYKYVYYKRRRLMVFIFTLLQKLRMRILAELLIYIFVHI